MLRSFFMLIFVNELCKQMLDYAGKKVLVLGGTKGLGLALAKELKKVRARVTILARNTEKLLEVSRECGFGAICSDIGKQDIFGSGELNYDLVFLCAGKCTPGFFMDQDLENLKDTMELNMFSTCNAVKQLASRNRAPFTLVMVASSLSLYTFPGYASYAASKSALSSFFETTRSELRPLGIETKIYYTSTINSESFYEENRVKPQKTINFESISYGKSCDTHRRAATLLKWLGYRSRISSDLLTYFIMINVECEVFFDFLLLPLAVVINQALKLAISIYFRNLKFTFGPR